MLLDFSADQVVIDNLEEVTYTSVRTAGDSAVTVPDAGYYSGGSSEGSPSYGVYTKGRAKFSIRGEALDSVGGAKPRDTVTLGGTVYTVLSATLGEVTQVWQIDAVDLVLAADLRQTCTISRPSNAQDTAGRASLASYTAVATDVACRVQPEGGTATDLLGRVTIPKRYTCILASQVDVRAKDRVVADGVTYTVLSVQLPERITDLPTLTLERVL